MNNVKVELNDNLSSSSCFICLELFPLNFNNDELIRLSNLFFKYLGIKGEVKVFVCEGCGESLTKFAKLSKMLEKVRLEMDYLLDSIKSEILNSKSKLATSGMASARKIVVGKCLEKMKIRKPQVILERVDGVTHRIKKERCQSPASDCGDDWLPNFDNEPDLDENDQYNSTSPQDQNKLRPQLLPYRLDISKLIKKRDQNAPDCDDLSNLHVTNSALSYYNECENPVINEVIDVKYNIDLEEPNHTQTQAKNSNQTAPLKGKCAKCSKIFKTRKDLKRHFDAIHLGLKPFKCSKCSKLFNKKYHLREHFNAVHLLIKPYKCDIEFALKSSLKKHRNRNHLSLSPFKCDICEMNFRSKSTLKVHKNSVHLHFKPYKCDMCDKSFAYASTFKRHNATPHKRNDKIISSKMFPCGTCKNSFTSVQLLKKHKRRVHPEKLIPCEICRKTFKTRGNLKKHVSSVHENKRIYCQAPGCDKNFSDSTNILYHYRVKHPDFKIPKPDERIIK